MKGLCAAACESISIFSGFIESKKNISFLMHVVEDGLDLTK